MPLFTERDMVGSLGSGRRPGREGGRGSHEGDMRPPSRPGLRIQSAIAILKQSQTDGTRFASLLHADVPVLDGPELGAELERRRGLVLVARLRRAGRLAVDLVFDG